MSRCTGYHCLIALAGALLLTACSGGASGGVSTSPAGGSGASNGGGTAGSGGGITEGSGAASSGNTRTFTETFEKRSVTFIAPEPAPTTPAPMLVLLPYQSGTAKSMTTLTRAGRLASQYGAWVVLPTTATGSAQWNDNPIGGKTPDDVGYLTDLIKNTESKYAIDPARVYMAGYSNSGFMASRFACERSDLISGIALIGATQKGQIEKECGSVRPLRVIMFNGTADKVVPYKGFLGNGLLGSGNFHVVYGVQDTEKLWEKHDGCSSAGRTTRNLPPVASDGTFVTLTTNNSCSGNAAVALYTINGGGHTWPGNQVSGVVGGFNSIELGKTTQNVDATITLWKFFIGQ